MLIWTWCELGKTRGDSPAVSRLEKPGPTCRISVVALEPCDNLGCRVTSMFAVYASAAMDVSVAASSQCAWYPLAGPLDTEQMPPGPGFSTSYFTIICRHLQVLLLNI